MALKLNSLKKSFGEHIIFDGLSLTFSEKGLYLVMGESGVGKTTLLRIISGLDKNYGGSVENGGIGKVSYMFQEYRLFPTLNSLKNVQLAQENDSAEDAASLLISLGFKHEDLKKKPHELSGGMKQRVAFARAVMKKAPILILDEPTKELDPDTASIMLDMISKEAEGRLVLLVTHDEACLSLKNAQIIKL